MLDKFYIPSYKLNVPLPICTFECGTTSEPSRSSVDLTVLVEIGENMKLLHHYIYFYVFGSPHNNHHWGKCALSWGEAIQSLQNFAPFLKLHLGLCEAKG